MEDEDEIQSPPSPETGSPASPSQNGRITVTVAAVPPPPQQNSLTLALPIQQPRAGNNGGGGGGGSGGGGGGGREDCWSEGATSVLIEAWGDRYLELSRGNLKQKHWKEVADIVSSREDYTKPPKTDIQCKNRIDTVKKKYKLEKSKIAAGGGPSKWPFYQRLDHLIGPTAKISTPSPTQKVPIGIPVGVRSVQQYHHNQQKQNQQTPHQQKQKIQIRRRVPSDTESSGSEPDASPDSTDSFPPETVKRPRIQKELNSKPVIQSGPVQGRGGGRGGGGGGGGGGRGKGWGNSVRELTQAIMKFGEAYEQAETSKLQQAVEMEKQRMKFAKDLELQRMQFFMKTQLEISQLKHERRVGNNHISGNNNNNNNNNNHSDSSN